MTPISQSTISQLPKLGLNWAFPVILVALGTILTATGVSNTSRPRYLIENGSTVLYGYLSIGLIAIAESGAKPAVALITALLLFFVVIVYVGSTIIQKITGGIPFIGIASLGTIALVGLFIVVAGVTIIETMLPMVIVAVGGTASGLFSLVIVKNAPR